MTTRAMSTTHASSPVRSTGSRWSGWLHMPSRRTATRVLCDVAVVAVTLTLAMLIAFMLFAPTLL